MNTSLLAKKGLRSLVAAAAIVFSPVIPLAHAASESTNTPTSAAAVPQGCKPYSGRYAANGIWCELHIGGLASGDGKAWGPFYTLRADAPAGYRLAWSEGHVSSSDHRCGVKDQADVAPSPRNSAGQLEGEAFYARCFITERDDAHVTMVFRIQGWEGRVSPEFSDHHPLVIHFEPDSSKSGGRAEIWAIFAPINS
jgi:hypothetical protein